MPSSSSLPAITIQPTFLDAIQDVASGVVPSEKIWVSCYKHGHESVHASVSAQLHPENRNLVVLESEREGEVQIQKTGLSTYSVTCPSLSIPPTQLIVPTQTYSDPDRAHPQHPHRITALAISPDNKQFATGFLDGSILIYTSTSSPTSSSSMPHQVECTPYSRSTSHVSTITALQFFPSSLVLLAASSDFSISILPASPPSSPSTITSRIAPARVLKGHTRTISAVSIISRGRGRYIISSSMDGTIRLWNVSSGQSIHTIYLDSGIADIAVNQPDSGSFESGDVLDIIVYAALTSGAIAGYAITIKITSIDQPEVSSSQLFTIPRNPTSKSPECIALSPSRSWIATGSSSPGRVNIYSLPQSTAQPALVASVTRPPHPSPSITSISFLSDHKLVIASADGLACTVNIPHSSTDQLPTSDLEVTVDAELVGPDCDAIRVLRAIRSGDGSESAVGSQIELWSASDDGIVRRYSTLVV